MAKAKKLTYSKIEKTSAMMLKTRYEALEFLGKALVRAAKHPEDGQAKEFVGEFTDLFVHSSLMFEEFCHSIPAFLAAAKER
jgi:hypothetical protein